MTRFRARLYACFALVYLVWGSSFLVARVGVTDLPPLLFTSLRSLIAGTLLLGLALYRGNRLPATRSEWRQMLFFSLVLIAFSSGSATFALKYIPSNEVALLNASMALWIAGLGTLGPKGQKLSVPSQLGLLLGFAGVALLVWPREMRDHAARRLAVAGAGSGVRLGVRHDRLSQHHAVDRSDRVQCGDHARRRAVLGTAGIVTGELPEWHWEWRGLLAIVFLAVFASALTYTAFTWLMKNARTDHVATFAYVNPAIATVLGWVVLGESLDAAAGARHARGAVRRRAGDAAGPLFLAAAPQRRAANFSNLPDEPISPDAGPRDDADDDRRAHRGPEARDRETRARPRPPAPTMPALSTSRNRPSVTIVIGNVRMNTSGRTKALTMPSSTAASKSLDGVVKCNPSSNWLAHPQAQRGNRGTQQKTYHAMTPSGRRVAPLVDLHAMVMESAVRHTRPGHPGIETPWNSLPASPCLPSCSTSCSECWSRVRAANLA